MCHVKPKPLNVMLVTNNSLCSVVSSKNFSDVLLNQTKGKNPDNTLIRQQIIFFKENGFRKLILSKSSLDVINNLKVPKNIHMDVLNSLPNRKDTIQIDGQTCIKYHKTNETINFIIVNELQLNPTDNSRYTLHTKFIHIDLIKGVMVTDEFDSITQYVLTLNEIYEKYMKIFLKVITFLELTDVEMDFISGINTKKKVYNSKLKNTSKFDVIYVTSKWNTMTVNINPIDVRGHWRLQPYGTGRSMYKYIWIEPFKKKMTVRQPQKMLV